MTTAFALSAMTVVGGLMFAFVYFPVCIWLYADYRKRGGRKSLLRYINENC